MKTDVINADLCVVGGGLAGVCAAIAAARDGAKVALIQDRPVLGGNSSSECRVHVQGASRHGRIKNVRETGIIEELLLHNVRHNPARSYHVWDTLLYDKVVSEPNIILMLNTSVNDAKMAASNFIESVTAWQLTSQKFIEVSAKLFADCSGDSILAPLTGAEFRAGREARGEFRESAAPEFADNKTMGMSCLFGARDMGRPVPFERPAWAYEFPTEDCFGVERGDHKWLEMGYWWIELGGDRNSIHDTEETRHELLRVVLGIWDHIKNHGEHGAENWALDFVQFIPGKRESRRYIGDHILKQGDIEAGGRFDDTVAYGGWSMDLHPPGGFFDRDKKPAAFHQAPSPYGIPYRPLYSQNIENLLFAGRNISATHVAIGSTRVMGTCSVIGQAVGAAAAIALRDGLTPREIGSKRIAELQQKLLASDCFLPGVAAEQSPATAEGKLSASGPGAEALRDGVTRPVDGDAHAWTTCPGGWVAYEWDSPRRIEEARISFDSDFDLELGMSHHGPYGKDVPISPPPTLVKAFRLEIDSGDGEWKSVFASQDNYQRFVRVPLDIEARGLRLTIDTTHGTDTPRVYRFEVV